ncbi:hypothetical protein WN51_12779 [Melipona quadrifasciata]|uniref:Uncharacterized protein n=1 Tax=Melipona quadrifasciata TaxID=166423 RepID=A0A0M9A1U9_9HYME|nr:hypothetical protein WN51_12779 [Melipona quadrifasciata]
MEFQQYANFNEAIPAVEERAIEKVISKTLPKEELMRSLDHLKSRITPLVSVEITDTKAENPQVSFAVDPLGISGFVETANPGNCLAFWKAGQSYCHPLD